MLYSVRTSQASLLYVYLGRQTYILGDTGCPFYLKSLIIPLLLINYFGDDPQNVTISGQDLSAPNSGLYPKISDNVIIYPGNVIVGGITVGKKVIIGANSFVSHDVPANSIVIGFNQIRKRNTCIGYIEVDN